jgi:imidazolonepropionase-like amidohydrolase
MSGPADADAIGAEGSRWIIDTMSRVVAPLAEAEANLLFGSDTPSGPTYANPPGLNGRLEMDNWIAAGVSEEKLFRALTIDNAEMMGLDGEIGTVEPGKTANLLLLGANPLDSITAYDTIQTVFLHGEPIARETLSARNDGME